MSDTHNKFVPGFFTSDSDASIPEDSAKTVAFKMDNFERQGQKQLRSFIHDSEKARNFDQSNVKQAKKGVKELFKDAINKAKKQTKEIKETARKEGLENGYTEGFQKGEQTAKEEFSPFLEMLQKTIQELSTLRANMYDKMEREMMEIVTGLAKKVIRFELTTREDAVCEMIRLAVQEVVDKESMTIKVNPADKEHAENFRPEIKQMFHEIKNICIEGHTEIERGGCMIETNFGTIDARIDKLTEQIDKILHLAPPKDHSPENPV